MPRAPRPADLTDPMDLGFMEDITAMLRRRWTDAQRIADNIAEAIKALDNGDLSHTQSDEPPAVRRRGMSKANREAASKRMKAYWAKKRRAAR